MTEKFDGRDLNGNIYNDKSELRKIFGKYQRHSTISILLPSSPLGLVILSFNFLIINYEHEWLIKQSFTLISY